MRRYISSIVLIIIAVLTGCSSYAAVKDKEGERIVAYVTSWGNTLPDPKLVTNINYAFGHVTDSYDGVRIDDPGRLRDVVALKNKNRNLKVQLAIGGWGSGGFSEMASDPDRRRAFAKDCKRVMEEYGLDGIDIDWEYPGSGVAGIGSSSADKGNFVHLMRDMREVLGKEALITFASPATVGFYEFKPVMPYVDFVNLMTYDLNRPPYHHSSLFRSGLSGDMTVDESVRAHVSGGVPADKLVVGVPFYGHGDRVSYPDAVAYNRLELKDGLKEMYDDVACVPYYVDEEGKMVMTYENEKSLRKKAEYVKANGLGGIMVWEAGGDTQKHDLLKVLHKILKK